MAKQTKNVNYSKTFQDVDSELATILEKCNNGKGVDGLDSNEREKLWITLFNVIKKYYVEVSENNTEILKNSINLILTVLSVGNVNASNEIVLVELIKYLNSDEFNYNEPSIINSISKVNEYWMVKIQSDDEIPGMEYFTLKYLLNLCTSDKPLVSDIQRLSGIRKSMSTTPFEKAVPSLRPFLIKLVQMIPVLSSEHGQRFIAQALTLSPRMMTEIHKTIMLDLGSCSKKKAGDYGRIYVMAWHCVSQEMKPSLEKICFQHLMETFLKEPRTSLELNKNSQNILAVLEVWHSERKKKHPGFITMMTNAYQPILWKYLQSGFNVHRCNATDLFFKAFPLQRCDDSASEAENFFNKQYDAMLASLTDDCHIVRIIGIREVCNILSHYWNSFSPFQIQNLMRVITKENATDASTAEVRRMVYIGLQSLVKSPLSCEYIKQILPNLANNIHDINQRVRTVFIQLLICIKEKKDPSFKYSDVVSMFDIQYRLAEDNIAVGQWIVKLLMRNYYHSKMAVVEWTKRFIYLIKTYKHSYRNLFFYSSKSLPFTDACNIIYEILSQLGMFVISRSSVDQDNCENATEKVKDKKRGGKRAPLSDLNRSKETSDMESSNVRKCAFDDPEVISGLIDIVTILWVLHDSELNKPVNEEVRLKLYDTYIKYAQPFINYYKDCDLFMGIISLSGNIPASLLRNNSITLPGYCIKMLKSIKVDRSDEENDKIISMLIALVKWGRGSEILEQVTLWLDAAFETQNMNETILPRRRVKISETIQPNSVVAIYILDVLLKQEYIKLSILRKNYNELFLLWKFMSRIRQLVETRLDQGEPFTEELVSDEFLKLCFRRYVKLIPLLKEDEGSEEDKENQSQSQNESEAKENFVNRQKEMENVVEWGENSLFLLLQQEDLDEDDVDLITTILEDILYVSDNMIIVHMVNSLFYFKTAHFVLKLLNTKYGPRFVKAASRIATALNFSAKQLFKVRDDLQIFSTVIPSILSHSLNVLTNSNLTPKEIEKLEMDFPAIKTNFGKVLAAFQDNLKLPSSLKENVRQLKVVVGFFVDCIVTIVSNDIPRKDSFIPLYSAPSQLPAMAGSLMSLFYNRKTWTPLFLHLITTKLATRSYDLKGTIACILLLHLCISDKKGDRESSKKALSSALQTLKKLKESSHGMEKQVDEPMETETTTKKTWLSNDATKGQSSTWTGLMLKSVDAQENTSKEVVPLNTETDDERMIVDESEDVSACQKKGTSLEEELLNCGFELIKNIENLLDNQTAEAEDSS